MGATCCNYQPKDSETLRLDGKKPIVQNGHTVKVMARTEEEIKRMNDVLTVARKHSKKVKKI